MFKKVHKAYEVLSNPISRQAYDIEQNITDSDQGNTYNNERYQDSTSQANYYQPRKMVDPYHTKWSNFKKPKWYHPYNGRDWRAEYMYTR